MIKRSEKFGGDVAYDSYDQFEKDYLARKIHPADLKNVVAEEVDNLIKPVRQCMKNKEALIKDAFPEN